MSSVKTRRNKMHKPRGLKSRFNPVAKHSNHKGGPHKDRKKDANKYQSRQKEVDK